MIGDDVLTQATSGGAVHHLLYDGHGSTRALSAHGSPATLDANNTYDYDAYGNALGFDPAAAATSLLYAGEYLASAAGQYYLRARHYDTANGRFNRVDPFAGNNDDPQSLHKYAYAYSNPVTYIDPSGLLGIMEVLVAGSIAGGLGFIAGYAAHKLGADIKTSIAVGIGLGAGIFISFLTGGFGNVAKVLVSALISVVMSYISFIVKGLQTQGDIPKHTSDQALELLIKFSAAVFSGSLTSFIGNKLFSAQNDFAAIALGVAISALAFSVKELYEQWREDKISGVSFIMNLIVAIIDAGAKGLIVAALDNLKIKDEPTKVTVLAWWGGLVAYYKGLAAGLAEQPLI